MFNGIFLLSCYIFLFIGGFYIFYFSNYSSYVKFPLILSFFLMFSYLSYVAGKIIQEPNTDMMETFKRFFFLYGKLLSIIVVLFIIFVILYKIFVGTMLYVLSKSIWLSLGLILLILALLKETLYKTGNDSDVMSLLKDIIFYIPCLLTDAIDYAKQDYLNTPSTTFIVFIFIIVYLLLFLIIPKLMNTQDGIPLITEPRRLNENILSLSTDELNALIIKNKPFYEKSNIHTNFITDFSYSDISYSETNTPKTHYPYDKLTANFIKKSNESVKEGFTENFTENFTSIQATDTNLNLNFNFGFGKTKLPDLSGNKDKDPQEYDYYKEFKNNKQVQKAEKGMNKFYSRFEAARDTLLTTPFGINSYDYLGPYISNYGLSFWVYFNTITPLSGIDNIISFGSKPSLLFDHKRKELIIKVDSHDNNDIIYKTKEILFQRWNHFVINFSDSKLTLFVNNNLVGFYSTQPLIKSSDLLSVGSTKNNNLGGICNFRYYENPLSLDKILSIYKKYNKKDPPL